MLLGPPLTASVPRPKPAKASQMRHTSSPPWAEVAAAMMPSLASVKAGEQAVFLRPSMTYSMARWLPALPAAL